MNLAVANASSAGPSVCDGISERRLPKGAARSEGRPGCADEGRKAAAKRKREFFEGIGQRQLGCNSLAEPSNDDATRVYLPLEHLAR